MTIWASAPEKFDPLSTTTPRLTSYRLMARKNNTNLHGYSGSDGIPPQDGVQADDFGEKIETRLSEYQPEGERPAAGTLDLSDCDIDSKVLRALIERRFPQLAGLSTLLLRNNSIDPEGAQCIVSCPHLKNLTELFLLNNNIGNDGAKHIANSNILKNLLVLDLRMNRISNVGAKHIGKSRTLSNLRVLDLWNNDIEWKGAKNIADSERVTNLRNLNLGGSEIGPKGAECIAKGRALTNLTVLDLGGCHIELAGAKAIAESEILVNLEKLELWNNSIGNGGARHIANSRLLKALTSLNLWNNNITKVYIVLKLLETFRVGGKPGGRLESINIDGNAITFSNRPLVDDSVLKISDPKALFDALETARKDGVSIRFGRAVLIGPAEAGKSTTWRFVVGHELRDQPIDPGRTGRTIGFDVRPFEETVTNADKKTTVPLRIAAIDTGGQLPQMQSHCALIYKHTRRSIFCLVLRRDRIYADNRAEWYLRMLDSRHGRRETGTAKLPVIVTTTRGEIDDNAATLELPDKRKFDDDYPNLDVQVLDPNIGKDANDTIWEKVQQRTRTTIIDIMTNLTDVTTTVLPEQLRVEAALRERFELDMDLGEKWPKVCVMSRAKFKSFLTKDHVIKKEHHGMHIHYLANAMALIVPDLDKVEYAEPDAITGVLLQSERVTHRPWHEVVNAVFNPKFILGLTYEMAMDELIRKSNGFMTEKDFDRLIDGCNVPREDLLTLVKKQQMVFEWTRPGRDGIYENGYLVPDQLPERAQQYKERWDDAICTAEVRSKAWLGEDRMFRLLADPSLGLEESIDRLRVGTEERREIEAKGGLPLVGVWRNEVSLKDRDEDMWALVQTDVFRKDAIHIKVSVRGKNETWATVFAKRIVKAMMVGLDEGKDFVVAWRPTLAAASRAMRSPESIQQREHRTVSTITTTEILRGRAIAKMMRDALDEDAQVALDRKWRTCDPGVVSRGYRAVLEMIAEKHPSYGITLPAKGVDAEVDKSSLAQALLHVPILNEARERLLGRAGQERSTKVKLATKGGIYRYVCVRCGLVSAAIGKGPPIPCQACGEENAPDRRRHVLIVGTCPRTHGFQFAYVNSSSNPRGKMKCTCGEELIPGNR